MYFRDMSDDSTMTLTDLKSEWIILRNEEPWDHAETFAVELFEIILATINGRNDLMICGPIPSETCGMVRRLRRLRACDHES